MMRVQTKTYKPKRQAERDRSRREKMPPSQAFAEVNGSRLYYEIRGSGKPVVFLHGFGSDSSVWDAQFEVFAEYYLVIRYDLRGHGKSAVPSGEPYTHAADLDALLGHLDLPQAHVIGQSLGGGIALDFALAYPEKATSLVLADPTLDGYPWSQEWNDSWTPIFTAFVTSGPSVSLPLLLAHPMFAPAFRQPSVKARLTQIFSAYSGWHITNTDPLIVSGTPALQRLHQIRVRVLVLVGELDLPDYQEISNLLLQKIPNAQKIEFSDTGHVLPMEAPGKFNETVLDFLEAK
jgi:3-oxoadipate enol-lactonase